MLEPGRELNEYIVIEYVGSGGMAEVYRVQHKTLGSAHAMKVLRPKLAASAELRERFLAEGRIQAQLNHPNIVAVTDLVSEPDVAGLVMEYLSGPTLAEHLQAHPSGLPLAQIHEIMTPILDAMSKVHRHGVVHRDLKPDNIKLQKTDGALRPVLFDFGIAQLSEESEVGHKKKLKTRAGTQLGTPAYMSPEQIQNTAGVDHRSDIFSLGSILYAMLTGKEAFAVDGEFNTMKKVVAVDCVPPQQLKPDAPDGVVSAINTALQRNPGHRHDSCTDMAKVLASEQSPRAEPTAPRRPSRRLGLVALVMFLTMVTAGAAAAFVAMPAQLGAHADQLVKNYKTDSTANRNPDILDRARILAEWADRLHSTPNNAGRRALLAAWSQGWHLTTFTASDAAEHRAEIEVLVESAMSEPSAEGALAAALVSSRLCILEPVQHCESAEAHFSTAAALLEDDARDWLRFEMWWTRAQFLSVRANALTQSNESQSRRLWKQTRKVCREALPDLPSAPVNDVFLARPCMTAAATLKKYTDYFRWAKWLRGDDITAGGDITQAHSRMIYEAAHPGCQQLTRSQQNTQWGEHWIPLANTEVTRFCYAAGLLAQSCPEQAAEVMQWVPPLKQTLPWKLMRNSTLPNHRDCYLLR